MQRIKRALIKFNQRCKLKGFIFSLKLSLYEKINYKKYQELVYKYIYNQISDIIDKYKKNNNTINCCDNYTDYPIWVCWWQKDNIPDLVKKCIETARKNANGHKVIFINENNWQEYVDIPKYIIRKLAQNEISITAFSDILRVSLLAKYGGLWVDATCFFTGKIPEELFKYNLYSIKNIGYTEKHPSISNGMWTLFFWFSSKKSTLFKILEESIFSYWEKNNVIIDYFLLDYIIRIVYDNILEIKSEIDGYPSNNCDVHEIRKRMNDSLILGDFNKIIQSTYVHKLSWKIPIEKKQNITFISKLLEEQYD